MARNSGFLTKDQLELAARTLNDSQPRKRRIPWQKRSREEQANIRAMAKTCYEKFAPGAFDDFMLWMRDPLRRKLNEQ